MKKQTDHLGEAESLVASMINGDPALIGQAAIAYALIGVGQELRRLSRASGCPQCGAAVSTTWAGENCVEARCPKGHKWVVG